MKKFFCYILCIITAISFSSCSVKGREKYSSSFFDLFDTASTVTAFDGSESEFNKHYQAFYEKLKEYNELYDIYNEYEGVSNICTLNKTAMLEPVRVDKRIIDLLKYGIEIYDISHGLTNICMGSVLSIWHEYREDGTALPSIAELEEASKHTDISSLIIDENASTVYFSDEKMRIDVGAIAKGYAAEEVCKWAMENLWDSAVISIGGNVITFGSKNGESWNIAIENPDNSENEYLKTVSITDRSIVTSADTQRYYTVNGKKYCHIINPDTLMPAEYMHSVTVICESSALGDALSTTLFNMPIDEGLRLIEGMENTEAIFIDMNYSEVLSSGFEGYIKE